MFALFPAERPLRVDAVANSGRERLHCYAATSCLERGGGNQGQVKNSSGAGSPVEQIKE
jgi:hypothetical protein